MWHRAFDDGFRRDDGDNGHEGVASRNRRLSSSFWSCCFLIAIHDWLWTWMSL